MLNAERINKKSVWPLPLVGKIGVSKQVTVKKKRKNI